MRAKYQVLVIPYKIEKEAVSYCIFQRSDMDCWQFIAGGGKEENDTPLVSAKREAFEEGHILPESDFTELETKCSISTEHFPARQEWGSECLIIPEHAFAVKVSADHIQISEEHTAFAWVDYSAAMGLLRFDSNRVALWEVDQKLKMGKIL